MSNQVNSDDLSLRMLEFSARIGKLVDALPNTRRGRHVASQLLRCGTAPGPNYEEGCAAESRNDFIHKLRICLKELRESCFWLRFICKAELMSEARVNDLLDEGDQLCRIIGQSVLTASTNESKQRRRRKPRGSAK